MSKGHRAALVLALLVACIGGLALSPLRGWLADYQHGARQLRRLIGEGPGSAPAFVALTAALIGLGAPRLAFCAIGGALYGFGYGLLYSQLGSLLGAYVCFALVRWGGRDWVVERWPRSDEIAARVTRHGVLAVIAMRQLPLGGVVINVALGLSAVRQRQFLIGTAIGYLPEAIPMVWIGHQAATWPPASWAAFAGGLALIAAIWLAGTLIGARMRRRAPALVPTSDEVGEPDEPLRV